VLYRDKLAGKYEAAPLAGLRPGARSLAAQDFDNDGEIDLLFRSGQEVGLILNRRGRFEERTLGQGGGGLVLADLENRGFADVITGSGVQRNVGLGQAEREFKPGGFVESAALAAADFDRDGRMDLASVNSKGQVLLLSNATPPRNRWLRVDLTGVKNLKSALGAEVEIKADTLYQKKIYDGLPALFGLGSEDLADAVRITWPNGLIQNEMQQAPGRLAAFQEAQRLSGSCPMIFTWNGREFQFVTDVLGVAPLGASAGDGQYFPVDHDEYVQIPGEALAPRNGKYEVRVTEELREVSYLDQVRLIAVDHPAEIEIFTNDKFKSPPFPEFRLFGVSRRTYPRAARDHRGRDIARVIAGRDRSYAAGFERDYSGVAETHYVELDFGGAAPDNRAVLILHGWVDWADGSTFLGASQGGRPALVMPYLQVRDAEGRWRTVIEDMGIPAGKPKTIAVDLTGKFLSASREIRIVTNLCVYWDEIFLSEETARPPVRLTPLAAETAQLGFRGFSRPIVHPRRTQPEAFDYSEVSPVSMWNPTPGLYTRYGDVKDLLGAVDDRLVVMGSGDKLRLAFDGGALPSLPAGWRRDFLLYVDGWAKDGDLNTAYSQTVEPLPFHGMSRYPYPESERRPLDTALNTRPALRLIRPMAEVTPAPRAAR
jgi:hypothetical protein